jgi:hypothetical protein
MMRDIFSMREHPDPQDTAACISLDGMAGIVELKTMYLDDPDLTWDEDGQDDDIWLIAPPRCRRCGGAHYTFLHHPGVDGG